MKVMLLGAGAVGAPLCTRLTKASELYLIMDDKRAEGYKGIIVNGLHYQIPLAKKGDKADLIILACKNFDLDNAISEIREHVRDNTIIMSLLNGVESEKHLEEAFPNAHVIYSFITSLSSNRDGNIINCYSENGGIIFLGEKNGTKTEELEKVISLFDMCNVTYQVSDNIIKEIWWKFMLNCAFNSLSGILETTYRKMYEKFGLIYRDADRMKLSRLGHYMACLQKDLNTGKENVLDKLRKTATDILSRYQLKNPQEKEQLPDDCDVLPAICIF